MKYKFLKGLIVTAILGMFPLTAFGAGIGDISLPTIPIYDSNGNAYAFRFDTNHSITRSKGYISYGNHIFTKNYYGGMFPIYMPYESGDAEPWKDMTGYIKENTQTKYGAGGAHLVPGYLNIKKGSRNPSGWGEEAYNGDNTGNMWVPHLQDYNRVEFRYQGYLLDGTAVDNPYFPDDVYNGIPPWEKNWHQIPSVTWADFKPSMFNDTDRRIPNSTMTYAQKTFETWFANSEIGANFKAKTPASVPKGQEWIYWNSRFQIQGDITDGSVIITGWHRVASGSNYYESFPVPSRPANNITVTEFELVDNETGDVLESYYQKIDHSDPMNISKMKVEKTDGKSVLEKGKKYTLRGKIYYTGLKDPSKDKATLSSRKLATIPAFMDLSYAYDANVAKYNTFDKQEGVNATGDTSPTRTILPGEEIEFEITDYVVPNTVKKEGSIQFTVPKDYLANGDNSIANDDYSVVRFKLGQNDLEMKQTVKLRYNGQEVDYVVPGSSHNVEFNIGHILGKTTIGLDNPNLKVDINIKDTANNILQRETITASELLEPGKTITVHSKPVTPASDGIIACATINKVHHELGLNEDTTNDTVCQTFKGVKNYAVKDLKITPHLIQYEKGVSSKTQPLSFTFTLANEGKNIGVQETPLVVIRQNGNVIKSERHNVPVGVDKQVSVSLPVNMGIGETTFEVEINPNREVKEFRPNNLPPYADNKKSDKVVVKKYAECVECTNPNSGNSWTYIGIRVKGLRK